MTSRTRVRPARPQDVAAVLALVRELAEYEREPDAVEADENDFRSALFGPDPRVHAFVAEVLPGDPPPDLLPDLPPDLPHAPPPSPTADTDDPRWDTDAEIAGIAIWFVSFSTWRGRHGIWLEDLFVRPALRGLGLGRALLAELAAECVRRGYPRLEWNVLDWNEAALGFYRRIGAEPLDEWTVHRLTGPACRTSPRRTSPRRTSPRRTSPRRTSPRRTSPRGTSPRGTSPRGTSPRSRTTPPRNRPDRHPHRIAGSVMRVRP